MLSPMSKWVEVVSRVIAVIEAEAIALQLEIS